MGTITLVSDVWDYIAELEIVSGNNAPDDGENYGPISVGKDWRSEAFEDRVCYRRSRDPAVAGSGLTDWSCITKITDGEEIASIN